MDGDGDFDVLVGNNGWNFLYINDGLGSFTVSSGLPTAWDNTTDVELDDREKAVLEVIRDDRLHIDEIGQALEIEASELAQLMTILEIKAIVIRYPGKFFERG